MVISEFFAKLGLDLDKASFKAADALMGGVKVGLVAVASAAAAAGGAILGMVKNVSETADKVDETSQSIGVSTDALQELAYASSYSGLGIDGLAAGLGMLTRSMAAAKDGSKETADAFRKAGVAVTDAHGQLRPADEVLGDLADKFAGMPAGAEKSSLAMKLFGRSGTQMIPFLNAGRDGIADLRQEAEDLGVVLDKNTIAQGAALDDSFTKLHATFTGLKNTIAGPLLEGVNGVVKAFTAWVRANRDIIKTRVEQFTRVLGVLLKATAATLSVIGKVLGVVIDHWRIFAIVVGSYVVAALLASLSAAAAAAGGYLALGVAAVSAGIEAAAAWLAAAFPVIALAALLAIVVLIAMDIYTWLTGGDSVIGRLWDRWGGFLKDFATPSESDPWWLFAIKTFLGILLDIPQAWDDAVAFWKEVFTDFFNWLFDVVDAVAKAIKETISDALTAGVGGVISWGMGKLKGKERTIDLSKLNGAASGFQDTFGTGRSPETTAAITAANNALPKGQAPFFAVTQNIQALPGMNTKDVADAATRAQEEYYQAKLRATSGALGGGRK